MHIWVTRLQKLNSCHISRWYCHHDMLILIVMCIPVYHRISNFLGCFYIFCVCTKMGQNCRPLYFYYSLSNAGPVYIYFITRYKYCFCSVCNAFKIMLQIKQSSCFICGKQSYLDFGSTFVAFHSQYICYVSKGTTIRVKISLQPEVITSAIYQNECCRLENESKYLLSFKTGNTWNCNQAMHKKTTEILGEWFYGIDQL